MNYVELVGLIVIWSATILAMLMVCSLTGALVFRYLNSFYKVIRAIGLITAAYWWYRKNPGMALRCLTSAIRYRNKLRRKEQVEENHE